MYATFRYWPDEGMHSLQKYLPVYSEYSLTCQHFILP